MAVPQPSIPTQTSEASLAGERRFIVFLAFVSGAVTLGCELAASRLLAPTFGTSMLVWSAIIGLMLIYLTVGYMVGGKLADRYPRPAVLYQITAVGAFFVGAVPFICYPILRASSSELGGFELGVLSGAFLAVVGMFAIPISLLGMVSPFAVRLVMTGLPSAGTTAGLISAISTLGSFIGTFLAPLYLIPRFGTRNTFLILSASLLALSLVGLLRLRLRGRSAAYSVMLVALAGLALMSRGQPVRAAADVVYETESAYNFIQVVQKPDMTVLKLNEGLLLDSVYRPGGGLSGGVWDTYLLAPLLTPGFRPEHVERVAVIGGAAGTLGKLFTEFYGGVAVDQAEIDPKVIEVGQRFFAMNDPNVTSFAMDGRNFLSRGGVKYDVIAIDAFRVPYVPFHLATKEFFETVRDRLTDDGVLAANVVSASHDSSLTDAIGSTLAAVFPSVYISEPPYFAEQGGPELGNALLIATKHPSQRAWFDRNLRRLHDGRLRALALVKSPTLRMFDGKGAVMTDDDARMEDLVHRVVWRLAMKRGDASASAPIVPAPLAPAAHSAPAARSAPHDVTGEAAAPRPGPLGEPAPSPASAPGAGTQAAS